MLKPLHKIVIMESVEGLSVETFRKLEITDEWISISMDTNPEEFGSLIMLLYSTVGKLRKKIKRDKSA